MSPKSALETIDYAPTREQVLDEDRRAAEKRAEYTRQKLVELRPRLVNILESKVAPPSRTCNSTTEVTRINGTTHLHVKHCRAFIRLEFSVELSDKPCLAVKLVVDQELEGTWTVQPSSGGANPLDVRFSGPAGSIALATGTNLGLNGLTDKTTQRTQGLVEHIVTTVNKRYDSL